MKVVLFNSCKNWGGGEKWHLEMAVGLQSKGFDVVAMAYHKSKLFEKFSAFNIPTTKVRISSASFLNPFLFFKIYNLIKNEKADCIILNLPADVKIAGIAAKIAGVKNIIYRRGSAIPIKNSFSNRFLFKRIISHVLVNSKETARTVLAKNNHLFPASKIKVIYNGINVKEFENQKYKPLFVKKSEEIVIGNLARLSKQKGHFYLLNLAKRLKKEGLEFKILIGGTGELEAELKSKVKEEHLENEVLFFGFIDNPKSFLSSIDIFVFPSIWEGFGFSLVEAKLMKKPIVAYDISSNPEVVRNNSDGLLAEPFNEKELQDKVLRLINDEQIRIKMGEYGHRDVIERFSQERTVAEVAGYLNKMQ